MPEVSADMMSKLATPEMMDTMQRMMKGMDPEALAGMMKQSGMDVTPEQAASMQQQVCDLSDMLFFSHSLKKAHACLA